jgi:hypothetical protein
VRPARAGLEFAFWRQLFENLPAGRLFYSRAEVAPFAAHVSPNSNSLVLDEPNAVGKANSADQIHRHDRMSLIRPMTNKIRSVVWNRNH